MGYKTCIYGAFLLYWILSTSGVFAQISNSTNYRIVTDTFSSGGDMNVQSSGYSAVMVIGPVTAGLIESAKYQGGDGFAYIDREPSISISPGSHTIQLGVLHANAPSYESHTLHAYSNARTGYTIRVYGNTLENFAGKTIQAIGASNQLSQPFTQQFGINLMANTSPPVGANAITRAGVIESPYATANRFAFQSGDIIAFSPTFSEDVYTVSYMVNISEGTSAGFYETTITYAISSNF